MSDLPIDIRVTLGLAETPTVLVVYLTVIDSQGISVEGLLILVDVLAVG